MKQRLFIIIGGVVLFIIIRVGLNYSQPNQSPNSALEQTNDETPRKSKLLKRTPRRPSFDKLSKQTPQRPKATSDDANEQTHDDKTQLSKPDEEEGANLNPTIHPDGAISQQAIDEAIRDSLPKILSCYQEAIEEVDNLDGRFMLSFEIGNVGGLGRVTTIDVEESELDDVPFEECVLGVFDDLEFDPPTTTVFVKYPFIFSTDSL